MANGLQNRSPRSVREAKAFRAVQVGTVAGGAFVITTILAIVGAIGDGLPILFALIMVATVLRFAQVTGWRGRR